MPYPLLSSLWTGAPISFQMPLINKIKSDYVHVVVMLYRRNKGRLRGCLMRANLAVVGLLPLYLGLRVGLDVGQHRVVEGLWPAGRKYPHRHEQDSFIIQRPQHPVRLEWWERENPMWLCACAATFGTLIMQLLCFVSFSIATIVPILSLLFTSALFLISSWDVVCCLFRLMEYNTDTNTVPWLPLPVLTTTSKVFFVFFY